MDIIKQRELAIHYHSTKCHSDHTDQCGWFYEFSNGTHNWNGGSHSFYFAKVPKFLNEDMKALDILNGVLGKVPIEVIQLREKAFEEAQAVVEELEEKLADAKEIMFKASADLDRALDS